MIIHEILLTAQKPKSSQYIHDVELYEHLWAKRYNQPRSPLCTHGRAGIADDTSLKDYLQCNFCVTVSSAVLFEWYALDSK